MKKNKIDDIKSVADLKKQIVEAKLKRQSEQVKNVHVAKNLRRKLAVALSVKRMKEMSQKGNA